MIDITLTGIKPTGLPHIGNYFGAIKPALEQNSSHQKLFFIADYHALTTIKDKDELKKLTHHITAAWLSLGLDPTQCIIYKQSDIPEIFELNWILSCFTAKGLLNRAHAYKAFTDDNSKNNKDPDKNINHGLFAYPVLMAADILLFNASNIPVGADQKQHVEIARDIAETFNHTYKTSLLTLPEPNIQKQNNIIPGIDGQKMSKNYNNTIPIFDDEKKLRKRIMQIKTDSLPVEAPKNPESCNLYALCKLFFNENELHTIQQHYINGGLGYGTLKQQLFEKMLDTFKDARKTFDDLINTPEKLHSILEDGAQKAQKIASQNLKKIKETIGVL
ncbi:tryptophan--tRNA ligase [Candidatus Marinamargulisbacteria bacterium SCGC AG-343-D04]|nr:tryptophan--tRNA ligase [Candidatus Marinamargulisbacteria bacterium SCGC AG-343-D04]